MQPGEDDEQRLQIDRLLQVLDGASPARRAMASSTAEITTTGMSA
jgi:hypothetical protein